MDCFAYKYLPQSLRHISTYWTKRIKIYYVQEYSDRENDPPTSKEEASLDCGVYDIDLSVVYLFNARSTYECIELLATC